MRKFFIFLIVAITTTSIAMAQDANKLSISTQIFMDKLSGKIVTDKTTLNEAKLKGLKPEAGSFEAAERERQFVADPVVKNGQTYMSAFIRLENPSAIAKLESLGVEIEEQFLDGKLVTALIPVDKIEEVSEVANVSSINAATLMKKSTKVARQKTNVDDVLTYSADAQSAGLPNAFDGSGVILGVIDTGIDFNHIAFKDANGNSRIKQAYVYNGSSARTYTGSSITSNLTDDNTEDHGTHTSSTAGGSSVTVSGSTVTVTNDHANATYGGMAPGADLYLAGINSLSSTYLSNAVKNMCTYADEQGKPLVVSNSWGSQIGPHDGTGDVADSYNSLFGDSHPNRVALFAASNDGGKSKDGEGGGYHIHGTASSSSPLRTILRSAIYTNTDAGYMYAGIIANAWARSTSVSKLGVKIHVLDASTGAIKTSVTMTSSGTVSGLSSYYSGSLSVYYDQVTSDKTQLLLYSQNGITSRSTSTTTQNGETYYKSKYTLAIEVYPISGSSEIDIWGGSNGYFTNHLSTSGYSWSAGSDDGCYSDEATIANVISIGAYVSERTTTNYAGTSTDYSDVYTNGDIAYFSSWGTAAHSPTGLFYPWISAPGARLIAGVNHNHTTSVDDYSYYGSNFNSDLKVNSTTSPYAYMEGTSMATPTAAGIVALWLQASLHDNAKSEWKNLTVNKVKQLMAQTAIHDSYTDGGANASHFGNGKIDALAGIQEILNCNGPAITANPTSLDFGNVTAGTTTTKTFTVTGTNLTGDISLSKSGNNFSIDKTNITKNSDGTASATVTVTFSPTANANATYTGTVTLTSASASTVTVSLTGNGVYSAPALTANPTSLSFTGNSGQTYTKTVRVTGSNLQGNVSVAISGSNVYSVTPTTITAAQAAAGYDVTVTWAPTSGGTTTANLVFTTTGTGANTVTVPITGTATGPSVTATPSSLSFTGYTGQTYTKTITVKGTNIGSNNITATLTGANVYSIDKNSITYSQATSTNGATITVTWKPTTRGETNATLTLRCNGVDDVVIPITGTAQGGTITASPTTVSFSGYATLTYTQTVNVTGANLEEDITATLNDANGIYSINPTSISKTANGVVLTITWAPTSAGQTTATVVLSSRNADDVTINITGNAQAATPTLIVEPSEITLNSYIGTEVQKTFNVSGRFINNDVTLTLTDANNVFSLGTVTIPAASISEETPVEVVVKFKPTAEAFNDYTGTVTVASNNAETKTIALTGKVNEPFIVVEPEALSFTSDINTKVNKEVQLIAENLYEDISVTLNDPSNVFLISTSTISIAAAEEAASFMVSFKAPAEGTYTGSVVLRTAYAEDITIPITATANDGGTASNAYLNIAKYATIDKAGNGNFTGTLYKFTQYEDDGSAWLTLPAYGAYQADSKQNWISTSITATTTNASWSATDIFLGNTAYGTTGATYYARSGSGWGGSYTTQSETFFVTNCSQVKVRGYNESASSNNTYPAYLRIYECTKNADGSITAATSAVDEESFSTKSSNFTLTSIELDESKIYKVVVSTTKSRIYEIGFKTSNNNPALRATPSELTLNAGLGETATGSITVKGKMLPANVTVTLDDPNGVFTVNPTTIESSIVEFGTTVSVAFNSAVEGTYYGTVTFTSGSLSATVTLTGRCSDGGTAKDAYLDIAKYETIDDAGATVSGMSTIYKYTEYEAQDIAWLTVSNYGAMSADANQNWYTTTSLTQYNNTWSASDIFLGNASYFTSSTSGYSIYGSGNQTFYVTNCSQVKALVKGSSWSSASATLAIYECTVNGDGTVTAATTATDSQQGGASGTAVITSAALDVSKVYMVRLTGGGSYPDMLEIAFQTPLPQEVTLAQIVNDPSVVAGKQYRIVDDNLIGAYLSNDSKYIFCKDDNGYAEQMTKGNKVDFMTEHGWHNGNWDQSNWIVLNVPAETDLTQSQDPTGHKLSGVRGTLINKVNPTLQLTKVPTPGEQATVNFNTYLATDFDPEMLAETGNYFFLPAKPMEVANVMWAMWDAASGKFVVASPVNNSTGRIDGAFYADLTKYYNDPSHPIGEIKDGYVYNFTGFAAVNVNDVSASTLKGISTLADETPGMVVYPLANWELKGDSNIITAINGVYSDGYREVVGVEYVNAAGLTSDKPFKGVNIVVTRYSDGSRTTVKKLYR